MIIVRTWCKDSVVWFELTGHAEMLHAEDMESVQVCAGVSTLMLTLYSIGDESGKWGGDGCGHIKVSTDEPSHALFVATGLQLLNNGYPGHIDFKPEGPLPLWLTLLLKS